MLRKALCGALLLVVSGATVEAARICDLSDNLPDHGDVVTISGRIIKSYGRDSSGDYGYDVRDSCGIAYVFRNRPIQCSGTVTITGKYDDDVTFELDMMEDDALIAVQATNATCR